jgi:hypothetical protein
MAQKQKIYIPNYISSVNYDPARVLPRLFFYNGTKPSETWYITNASNVAQPQNSFPYVDNYLGSETTQNSLSLLFNNEVAPYGEIPSASLYTEYWEDYVNLLYNPRTRLLNAKAIIPLAAYSDMNLNDVVQFRGNLYHLRYINDYSLTTGECNIQLLGPLENDKVSTPVYSYCLTYSAVSCVNACYDTSSCFTTTTTTTGGPTTTTTAGPTTTTTAGPTTTTSTSTSTTTMAPTTTTTTANPNSNCLYYTIFNTTGFQRNYIFTDCADCIGPKLGVVQPNATVFKCAVSGSVRNETNGLVITAGSICGNGCPTTTTTTSTSTTTLAPTTTTTTGGTTTTTTAGTTTTTTTEGVTTTTTLGTTTTSGPTTTLAPTTTTTTACPNCVVYSLAKQDPGSAGGIGTYKDCNGCIQTIDVQSQQERYFTALNNYSITWTGGLRLRTYGQANYVATTGGCTPISSSCKTQEITVTDPGTGIFFVSYIDSTDCTCKQLQVNDITGNTLTIISGSYSGNATLVTGSINNSGSLCCIPTTTTTTAAPTTTTTTAGITYNYYTLTRYTCPTCSGPLGGLIGRNNTTGGTLTTSNYYNIGDGYVYRIDGYSAGSYYDIDLDGAATAGTNCTLTCAI